MKTTTLLKTLFLCITLSITALVYAQDEPTIPEVTTMEEVIAALGDNDQTVGVRVHFKNLEPIFVVKSLYTDIYMPDGTTLLKFQTACPKKFDAIGRYYYNDDNESSALGFKFEVEEITAAYAFHNLYYLAKSKTQNAVEIVNPVVVTAVDNNNVFIQYQDFDKTNHGDLLIVEGEHSLQIGDQITGFTATLNSAKRDSTFIGTDTIVTMIRNTYFNVNASTFGSVEKNKVIKYKATTLNDLIGGNAEASAIQLPVGGTIVKKGEKYLYKVNEESVEVRSNTVNLDEYLDNPISEMVRGVIDYYHTAENRFNVIITEIKALDTNYATIAEWINAAQSGLTTGTLKNPVNVTLSVYQSYKSFVFIQDETGAICLNFGDYKENPIKTGDVITGIEGNLEYMAANAPIAPIINIGTTKANIQVVDSNIVVKPIDVTIAELNADEDAIKEGAISKFANRLVKINGVINGTKWVGANPKIFPLIQGEDTLTYSTNTLNAFPLNAMMKKDNTSQMTITGVIDYKTINSAALYSIYPRSVEDVHLVAPEFVPAAGMYEKEVEVAITMLGEQGVDYTAIYYTTDPEFNPEDDPEMLDGEEYTAPLRLTKTTTIYAIATYLENESKLSPIVKATYTIINKLPTESEFPFSVNINSNDLTMGNAKITNKDCSNNEITITATPNEGYHFVKWSDGDTNSTRTIIVTSDITLTAEFAINTYNVTLNAENGVVIGSGKHNHGVEIIIAVIANENYKFSNWSDENTENPRSIIVTNDISLEAILEVEHPKIEEHNNFIVMPANETHGNVKITITAEAIEGFEFDQWSDGNTENPRIVTLDEDIELYAYFKMAQGGIITSLETSKISSANIYTTNGTLHIEGATDDYHILDATGRLIYSGNATTLQLPQGIYLVTLNGEVEKVVL